MTFDEIYNLIEDDNNNIDQRTKFALERIIQAETDWRTEIKSLKEFIGLIENRVNGESSIVNVSKKNKQFEANIPDNAWEAESFASIMEVFEYDPSKSIREIFEEITNGLNK